MRSRPPPLVLLPACNRRLGRHPFYVAGKKYVDGVRLAGCLPLVVPGAPADASPQDALELAGVLELADGVLLTGSPSNVHPRRYGQPMHDAALPLDDDRDAWTLPFVPQVLERGIPLLAICRGAQEVNVALGGSLHQAVHAAGPFIDHRDDDDDPVDVQYGPAHPVTVAPGGVLDALLPQKTFDVNSLHGQGVDRLAAGLRVEARAPDGLVEAFSVPAKGFALAVQWHPEWQAADNPVSLRIFRAFGSACTAYRDQRDRHRPPPP